MDAAFKAICKWYQISMLELFLKRFPLSPDLLRKVDKHWYHLIKDSCKNDNKFIVSWLVTRFPLHHIPEKYQNYVDEIKLENENDDHMLIKPASKRARVE